MKKLMVARKIPLLLVVIVSALGGLVPVAFAKTHRDSFGVPCRVLWPAVKDAVTKSGKYTVMSIYEPEMTVSYFFGNAFAGKRINSVVLNREGDNACEMQTQTSFSGLAHNDAGAFKKRVEKSLEEQPRAAERTVKEAAHQGSGENKDE